ncbi:non-specific protein-tyrosine kinase [Streptosporangium album]|uniref:non-specific protein-tyrosine kinase n=1 Tax=Streptosporangium album TaxID=47479 RepID=A0A7W7W6F9_9ACTN|nr:polysaccharide biosynthesis tyrosine autokinase [Streptosporangium album]MBB4935788.1 non-specific protein-tyrosine kinase [Streptosporangium album]
MDLLSYLRLIRRNWLLILFSLGVAVAAAAFVTAHTPPKYVATITMLVSGHDREGSLSTAYQAGALSQQRVQSYAELLTSRRVIEKIAEGGDVQSLQGNITAESIPSTVLIRATVTDTDPARAAQLANALGTEFPKLISEIERPAPNSRATVKVTMVDRAIPPVAPVAPRPLVNLALAVVIALFVSVGSFILRDHLDTTIKSDEALQQASKSAILGVVGYERDARRLPLIIRHRGRSSRAEAFRSLRTNLQFVGVDRHPKSLVVTSCLPGEGKSSTAANLAITLAQAGWRVILVDGDLRRPRIPDYFGIEGTTGLTDVLIERAGLQDVIQTWGAADLSILPSGQIPPNPSELLSSRVMRSVLSQLTEAYDMVIIDAPPLLPITDAAALAAICDGTLLIARYGRTRREHVVRVAELLSSINARLVGAVLNFAPARNRQEYGYGYGYGYESDAEVKSKTPTHA